MRVLITGAAGFLGSHLADRFLRDGHHVVGLDNFITGNPDNIAHLTGHDRFEFVKHNISTYTYLAGTLDGVLHFASPASPIDYLEHPIATLKVGAAASSRAVIPEVLRDIQPLVQSPAVATREIRIGSRTNPKVPGCRFTME